ncbi:Photosystem i reaction center subunit n protein [Thalictrum thalictroides]|uniref:Photosystem i reaction center subunit n protein n=1 Tax=Thalictrum thalictroides TaxID=46969 RepID=A0A7J6WQJ6_THATH|nr:Photosystem i reaction center subunit n protein [Thalictrum thalictroides]
MTAVNSSVLACKYAIVGYSESTWKLASSVSMALPSVSGAKLPMIKAQQARVSDNKEGKENDGRKVALLGMAAVLLIGFNCFYFLC